MAGSGNSNLQRAKDEIKTNFTYGYFMTCTILA